MIVENHENDSLSLDFRSSRSNQIENESLCVYAIVFSNWRHVGRDRNTKMTIVRPFLPPDEREFTPPVGKPRRNNEILVDENYNPPECDPSRRVSFIDLPFGVLHAQILHRRYLLMLTEEQNELVVYDLLNRPRPTLTFRSPLDTDVETQEFLAIEADTPTSHIVVFLGFSMYTIGAFKV